jgi:hypothetical protein
VTKDTVSCCGTPAASLVHRMYHVMFMFDTILPSFGMLHALSVFFTTLLDNRSSSRSDLNLVFVSFPKSICFGHSVQNLLSSSLLSKNVKIKIYRTIILHVLLYGCESWSLTFREECRLKVFENRLLRRIFGPKRDEVTVEWRRLHNKELHALYFSQISFG